MNNESIININLSKDYEDQKNHWFISEFGRVYCVEYVGMDKERIGWLKEIGNWFDSEEDAKKVVEKFKAFKRLKNKGFKFEGWDNTDRSTIHHFSLFVSIEDLDNINKDLNLLFGWEK